jgi:hypothetical protein
LAATVSGPAFTPAVILFIALPEPENKFDYAVLWQAGFHNGGSRADGELDALDASYITFRFRRLINI